MSQNFACFFGQLWIQNPIIVDSFKFSVPLSVAGALMPHLFMFSMVGPLGATTQLVPPLVPPPG